MILKRIIIFIGSILVIYFSYSQLPVRPYQPINFQNLNYDWKDVIFDSTLISDSIDGYNMFSSIPTLTNAIITEDNLYETYNVFIEKEGNIGYRLINRNLSTGTQIWKYDSYSDSISYQEFPFFMFRNGDYIFVYSYLKPENYNFVLPFFSSTITDCSVIYRKILKQTGEVVESNLLSIHDENYLKVTASQAKNKNYGEIVFFENENKLLYWERNTTNPLIEKQTIHFQKIMPNGIKIGLKDSVEIGKYSSVVNLHRWADDTLVYFEFKEGDNFLNLLFYNSDFQLIGERNWENLPFTLIKDSYIIPEGPHISIYSVFHGGSFKTIKQHTLCNRSGETLDYVELIDNLLLGDEYFSLPLNERKKIIIYKSKYEENPLKPITYLYYTNGSGQLGENFYQLVSLDSMRHAWPRKISEIGNDQILINFIESAIYREPGKTLYSHDYRARAQSLMLFHASDIGLGTVSTSEEKDQRIDFRVFPTPTSDKIVVQANQHVTGQLNVIDQLGRVLLTNTMVNQDELQVSISHLMPGMYFLILENNGSVLRSGKFVKM